MKFTELVKYIIKSILPPTFFDWLRGRKKINEQKIINYNLAKSKLGVTYNLFSGEELLEKSILQIRNNVDYINVVFQKVSWYGDECDPILEKTLNDLKSKKLVDNIIFFDYKLPKNIQKNNIIAEVNKHLSYNIKMKKKSGIDDLIKNNCTHCMIMDVDEFYDSNEFKKAKEFIIGKGYTHSAVAIYRYFYKPTIRGLNIHYNTSVPFIMKLKKNYTISPIGWPCDVDPLRCFSYNKYFDKFYYTTLTAMHHMTRVRKDLDLKFSASELKITIDGVKDLKDEKDILNKIGKIDNSNDIVKELNKIYSDDFVVVRDKFSINS